MNIIALNGSHNKQGNTAYLLDLVLEECRGMGANVEMLNLYEIMMSIKNPFCTACSTPCDARCYKGSALERAFEKITDADAVIMGSPVYFGSVTAAFKAFFDKTRKIRGEKSWIGKKAAAVAVGASKYGGQESTIATIHNIMFVEGMTLVGDSQCELGGGHFGVAAQKPSEQDEYAKARVKVIAKRLMEK